MSQTSDQEKYNDRGGTGAPADKRSRRVAKESSTESSPEEFRKKHRPEMEIEMMEKMGEMMAMMKNLQTDIADLKRGEQDRSERMNQLMNMFKADKEERLQENTIICEKLLVLERRINQQEKQEKRRNMILSNYKPRNAWKLRQEIEELFKEKTGEIVELDEARLIKLDRGDKVIVKARYMEQKIAIMKKKTEMYEITDGKRMPIYIDDDHTREERDIQKKARDMAKKLREEGHEVKVGYQKVIKNGKLVKWNREAGDFIEEAQ